MIRQKNESGYHVNQTDIAFICFQTLDRTFSITSYLEISEHLANRGNKIDLFAIRSRFTSRSNHACMRLISVPLRSFPILTHLFYVGVILLVLPFYVCERRPRFVIIEPKFGSSIFGLELKVFPRQLRPKTIMDIRSTPVEVRSIRTSLGALAFEASVALAKTTFDGFTILTSNMKREVSRRFGINPLSMKVWTSGVNTKLFKSNRIDGSKMRAKFALADRFIVFYHGGFGKDRGVIETVKSIQFVKSEYPKIVLFLLGGGPAASLLEQLVSELQLKDNVIIHKPVQYADVPKYISMCDVGIVPLPDLPDWRSQSPLKLLEYLSMGKSVIVSDIPANREIVANSELGIYVSSVEPPILAKGIEYAYANRENLPKWGLAGIKMVEERYSWDKIAEEFERYLTEFAQAEKTDSPDSSSWVEDRLLRN